MNRETSNTSLVAVNRFILATRDSGYRDTASAVSELVDNAIQAAAQQVTILVRKNATIEDGSITVAILDDGEGMAPPTLREALRFGGSSRFDDRRGLGRYGMGLPNASLSQSLRVEVYSWQSPGEVLATQLDVDEVVAGQVTRIPEPRASALPPWLPRPTSTSGTVVIWSKCDRLDSRRVSTLERRLKAALGRVFRHFLWNGLSVILNGEDVTPLDPLFLRAPTAGAQLFGEPLEYQVRTPSTYGGEKVGVVRVLFSELPVHQWHHLTNEEKRRRGIANGAGISVVRAGREIDHGWFFLNAKRRENYDDWWRGEIHFDPVLDEVFGITHTKQQVRPTDMLAEVLEPEILEIARALNARARQAHQTVPLNPGTKSVTDLFQDRDRILHQLPPGAATANDLELAARLRAGHKLPPGPGKGRQYCIVEDDLGETCFFRPVIESTRIVLVINPRHRFYTSLYQPLVGGTAMGAQEICRYFQVILLAACRAEASAPSAAEREAVIRFRCEWSQLLEILLRQG
ncbi:MAG: ATP-binding protein [Thermoanaerobaculaceae bacterium]